MKGFVRILESIIASIILLTSMTFFLTPTVIETGWDDVLTQVQSQDILSTIYKNGSLTNYVKFNDIDSLNNELSKLFSKTLDFSIEVHGIPNPEIYIGCNCTDTEISNLKNMLSPLDFRYMERNISIRISNESIENMRNETNILFIFGYKNLSKFKNNLDKFLERGGTIFILGDLTENQVKDGYLNDTFGLSWYGTGNPSNDGEFYDTTNPGIISYKISKYFVNISGLPETTLFKNFNRGPSINRIGIDGRTIIKDTSNRFSFVKANKNIINVNGRTVWFAGYSSNETTDKLLKATIIWASGERYNMNPYKKTYPKKYIKTKYVLFDKDAYEIELTVWRIFY